MQGDFTVEHRRQTHNSIFMRIYDATDYCSRQTLARDLQLSQPTVYQHVAQLMQEGLVEGSESQENGRRGPALTIVADTRFAVGISVMEDRIQMEAANLRLEAVASRSAERPFQPETAYGDFLAREMEKFLEEEQLDRSRMLGVGIAVPGILSPDGEQMVLAPDLQLRNVSLAPLREAFSCPVHMENDASCGGHAEWFVRKRQCSMAYFSLENRIGGAVLINGADGLDDSTRCGKFGHMCVESGGLSCRCGRQGCLEAYCSARRISDDMGLSLDMFFQRVEEHDPECETIWYDLLRHLATGINTVRMVLGCDVVLGGFLAEYLDPYLPSLEQYILSGNPFDDTADFLRIGLLGRDAIPLGAALYFIRKFLESV